jgi:UDP-N-acetylglucosamine 2-epimerase
MKIMPIFGTRPEAVKLSPVIHMLRREGIETVVLSTGQHDDLLAPILDWFGITPDGRCVSGVAGCGPPRPPSY